MPESKSIPFAQIMEPKIPARFAMDDAKLAELADSIKARGLLQPIGVFPCATPPDIVTCSKEHMHTQEAGCWPQFYEIIFGHRRYKACQIICLKVIPCLVFESDAKGRYADMMAENLCREDITAAEEAIKYDEAIKELDCTEEELLKIFDRPASYIYARLDLLKGHKAVFDAVAERKIGLSVAQQLNRVDDEQHCLYLLNMCIEGGASARVVMSWVTEYKRNGPGQIVDITAFREAGKQGPAAHGAPECVLCGKNSYPANIKWVPVHDFELEQIQAGIQGAAALPAAEEVPHAQNS